MGLIRVRDTLQRWLDSKVKFAENGPRGWTHEDLAKAIDVSESLVKKIMSGHANVTTKLAMKLCEFTRYDLGELFTYDPHAESKENGDKDD